MGVKPPSFHFVNEVTMFWHPTFQMENLNASRFKALSFAPTEAEHRDQESFAKELGAALGISEGILFVLANEDKDCSVL